MVYSKKFPSGLRMVVKQMEGLYSVSMGAVVGTGSCFETAKENGLDPYQYLLWLLQNAQGLSETDEAWAEKLLPARARKNAICRKNR